eukprot:GHVN01072956.1.p1 GENE.GHVN01072956.1~~GHVN01072956.1.p1  ORF type:complete len:924 (+),score=102.90 GHVN01072956.1:2650-5421(+)
MQDAGTLPQPSVGNIDNIKVAVRIRPPTTEEGKVDPFAKGARASKDPHTGVVGATLLECGGCSTPFVFDHILDSDSSQDSVFQTIGVPLCRSAIDGYNVSLFAYGQTGSGKTYTIQGEMGGTAESTQGMNGMGRKASLPSRKPSGKSLVSRQISAKHLSELFPHEPIREDRGLLPRCLEVIFSELVRQGATSDTTATELPDEVSECHISYIEIYQEQIYDLLANASSNSNIVIRESPVNGVYLEGVQNMPVRTLEEALAIFRRGSQNRKVHSTEMNHQSSRAHAVFTVRFRRCLPPCADGKSNESLVKQRASCFHVIDLAGSERQKTSDTSGERLKEAAKINASLSVLGMVIATLARQNAKAANQKASLSSSLGVGSESGVGVDFVHYRDSKLTHLLKDAIGGNSKTAMIASISPEKTNSAETLSTLRFALNVKNIRNTAIINEWSSSYGTNTESATADKPTDVSVTKNERASGKAEIGSPLASLPRPTARKVSNGYRNSTSTPPPRPPLMCAGTLSHLAECPTCVKAALSRLQGDVAESNSIRFGTSTPSIAALPPVSDPLDALTSSERERGGWTPTRKGVTHRKRESIREISGKRVPSLATPPGRRFHRDSKIEHRASRIATPNRANRSTQEVNPAGGAKDASTGREAPRCDSPWVKRSPANMGRRRSNPVLNGNIFNENGVHKPNDACEGDSTADNSTTAESGHDSGATTETEVTSACCSLESTSVEAQFPDQPLDDAEADCLRMVSAATHFSCVETQTDEMFYDSLATQTQRMSELSLFTAEEVAVGLPDELPRAKGDAPSFLLRSPLAPESEVVDNRHSSLGGEAPQLERTHSCTSIECNGSGVEGISPSPKRAYRSPGCHGAGVEVQLRESLLVERKLRKQLEDKVKWLSRALKWSETQHHHTTDPNVVVSTCETIF